MYSRRTLVAFAPSLEGLPGSWLIFPRALSPTTPEGPMSACACCFLTGVSGFILRGGLAAFDLLTRPNRVHLRYGSRVRLPSSRQLHYWISRSFGYMQNRQLHDELLTVHKIKK
jgi:hypothetical protein